MEEAGCDRGRLPRVFLPAAARAARPRGGGRGAAPGEVVRAGARGAVPGAGLLHRGGDRRVRRPQLRDEVSRCRGEQGAGLRRGERFRVDPGGLFVHGAAAVRGHLPHGSGPGAGDDLPLFRPGDQRPRDHPDRPHPGPGAGHRPGGRGDRLQHRPRPGDAVDLPQGRGPAGRRAACDAAAVPTAARSRPPWSGPPRAVRRRRPMS